MQLVRHSKTAYKIVFINTPKNFFKNHKINTVQMRYVTASQSKGDFEVQLVYVTHDDRKLHTNGHAHTYIHQALNIKYNLL